MAISKQLEREVKAVAWAMSKLLDVEKVTEILAREHWNRLPLVAMGSMPTWDEAGTGGGRWAGRVSEEERKHFRDRLRPYAVALRVELLGEER
jgi:hypothetical protein